MAPTPICIRAIEEHRNAKYGVCRAGSHAQDVQASQAKGAVLHGDWLIIHRALIFRSRVLLIHLALKSETGQT